jgi:hypothetical protein
MESWGCIIMHSIDPSHIPPSHPNYNNPAQHVGNPAPQQAPAQIPTDPTVTGAHHHGGGGGHHAKVGALAAGENLQKSHRSWKSNFAHLQQASDLLVKQKLLEEEKKKIAEKGKEIEEKKKEDEENQQKEKKKKEEKPPRDMFLGDDDVEGKSLRI